MALLAACGNDTETINEEPDEETEITESTEEKDDKEDNNEDKENEDEEPEDEESSETDAELTEDEAEEKVRDYINEYEDYDADDYLIAMREEDGDFYADIHAGIATDEEKGNPILHEYKVDRVSGDVEETDIGPYKQDAYISEVVSMSQEEKNEHHREIAQNSDELDEKVLDKLLLPGLHGNTKEYEGRINPEDTIERVSLKTADDPPQDEKIEIPEVDDEGYFTIDFSEDDLETMSVLTIVISGDDYDGQVFEIPINESDNKMEYISVHEDNE